MHIRPEWQPPWQRPDSGRQQDGTGDTSGRLTETWQHLTRRVGTVPRSESRAPPPTPRPEESWSGGEVTSSLSFKFAFSKVSRAQQNQIQSCKSPDLGLEDRALSSPEWLMENPGERKSSQEACLCSPFQGSMVRICRILCVG